MIIKGHGNYKCPKCGCKKLHYFYSMDKKMNRAMCKDCLYCFETEYDGFFETPLLEENNEQ